MLTDTFAGRCLVWRGPTAGDHLRFPSEAVPGVVAAPLPRHAHPVEPCELTVPATGATAATALDALLQSTGTTSFIALRGGAVVCEWHAPGHDAARIGRTMSVSKSIGALLVGQAIAAGKLPGVEAPLGDCLRGVADPGVARLSIAQLLRMASGIGYREGSWPWTSDAQVYHGTQLRQAALRARIVDPVDRFFHYNDWHPLLLAMALEQCTGARVATLLGRELWTPLGCGAATVSLDNRTPAALAHLESGINCSTQDLARFGQLVLQQGQWQGRQLVPRDWLERLDDPQGGWSDPAQFSYYARLPWGRPLATGRYGYKDFWWLHRPQPGVQDLFARGALGAHVYVSRDTGCVLVRQASRFPRGLWWPPVLRALAQQLASR